ncbi:MAG: FecR domain-containing protein [Paenibacillus sp.]|nr:FecR domain-containing protein [Paenibacillus sp.]
MGTITPEESRELEQWAGLNKKNREFLDDVSSPDSLARWRERRRIINTSRPAADMRRRIASLDGNVSSRRHRIPAYAYAAAAVVLLLVGLSLFLFTPGLRQSSTLPDRVKGSGESHLAISDIRSGRATAVLNTNSGVTLALSDTTLSTPEILFTSRNHVGQCPAGPNEIEELCLRVPRGGEFKITLEDSTVVWLNADSRLIYPAMFSADERRVRVTGEAYFAVHHETDRPFYVETGDQEIKVYGTTFNVRDYADDATAYTTLESGSVAVSPSPDYDGEVMLSPGHQMAYEKAGERFTMRVVDPQVVTSWRHGKFVFEDQPLKVIMRDLSRWYDFEYEFASPDIEDIEFLGTVPRYADFATAVSVIEKCADLRFTTRAGKVYIMRR